MSDISRRTFLTTTAAAGTGLTILPRHVLGRGFQAPSDTVNIATVGFGGMGGSNTRRLMSQNIVAICDVDDALADAQLKRMATDAASAPAAPQQPQPQAAMSKAQMTANARRPRIDNAASLRRFTSEQIPRLRSLSGTCVSKCRSWNLLAEDGFTRRLRHRWSALQSADDEVFFPQDGPVGSAQLDSPVACSFRADGIAAERPIPSAWTRGHTKPPDLLHTFAAIPPMLHGRLRIGQQSRVENVGGGFRIAVHWSALPVG